jgi:hypothetical protein
MAVRERTSQRSRQIPTPGNGGQPQASIRRLAMCLLSVQRLLFLVATTMSRSKVRRTAQASRIWRQTVTTTRSASKVLPGLRPFRPTLHFRFSSRMRARRGKVTKMKQSWLRVVTIILSVAALLALTIQPAYAGDYQTCVDGSRHDDAIISVKTILNHSASPHLHKGEVRAHATYGSACSPYAVSQVVDYWITTYADKLVSGSWNNCSSKSNGWLGHGLGYGVWWTVTKQSTAWYSGAGSCQWGQYTVRSRAQGKAQYKDGHIITAWAYNPGHPHL